MSLNQSRAEKSEASQLRKTGRPGSSGHNRGTPGGGGKGGAAAPPPLLSSSSPSNAPALSANRSFKKSGNGQSGQSGPNHPSGSSAAAARNGAHVQPPSHVSSEAPPAPSSGKPADSSTHRNSRAVPRPPTVQSAAGAADSAASVTPVKGDASRSFTLQFGTINAGVVNGMQIPARTSSAPPNLDEQKRAQAHHDASKAVATLPTPSAPKQQQQQLPKKDTVGVNQLNTLIYHPPTQAKRDMVPQTPAALTAPPPRPSGFPMAGMPMSMPFQPQQIPVQFGGPGPQMQSQGVESSSLQMAMTLPVVSGPQVPRQMFVPGLQSHPLQAQAMMHQGQGMGYAPPMGHQMTPQFGNMGIGISAPQFTQQQPGKFGGSRKTTTVKITHPETHEEVRFDKWTDTQSDGGSSGQRPLTNLITQSQPVPSFNPSHQMNYFPQLQPGSYSPSPIFYPTSTSHPLTSTQMTTGSQAPRYSYSVGQSGQSISFMNPSILNPAHSGKAAPSFCSLPESVNAVLVSAPSAPVQVTVKPAVSSPSSVTVSLPVTMAAAPKSLKPTGEASVSHQQGGSEIGPEGLVQHPKLVADPSVAISLPATDRHPMAVTSAGSIQRILPESTSAPVVSAGVSGSVAHAMDGIRREPIQRLDSLKGQVEKLSKKDIKHSHLQNQVDASDPAGDTKLFSFKSSNESILEDMTTRQASKDSENIQDISEEDVSNSSSSLPFVSSEHSMSSEVKTSEVVESKTITSASGSSGATSGEEESQDVPLACHDTLKPATNTGMSIVDRTPTNTPSYGHDMEGPTLKSLHSASSRDGQTSSEAVAKQEIVAAYKHGQAEVSDDFSQDSTQTAAESFDGVKQVEQAKQERVVAVNIDKPVVCESHSGESQQVHVYRKTEGNSLEIDKKAEEIKSAGAMPSNVVKADASSANPDENKTLLADVIADRSETSCSQGVSSSDPGTPPKETAAVPTTVISETKVVEGKVTDQCGVQSISVTPTAIKEKSSLEMARTKTASLKKKKMREILSKADAAGTSDLYNAYKGPEKKHETTSAVECIDTSLNADSKSVVQGDIEKDVAATDEDGQGKAELDDWEDAADVSTPNLRTSDDGRNVNGSKSEHIDYGNEAMNKKKYSRDFLLTFQEQYTSLPIGFEIGSDMVNALMSSPIAISNIDREPYPSPGRMIVDRFSGVSRGDWRSSGIVDDDKWTKTPNSFSSGRDFQMDAGHGAATVSLRPGQGVNNGVLRNPRGQSSHQFAGGILSGPMQSPASQGGLARNNIDADRWQRATGIQRGLIPSPQTPLQVMHKAEKKYEVGKASDEEEAKQRQLKAILNKLTPQNFEKLFQQVKDVNIDNAVTLTGVISQIFDKALMEPTFCEMYANFCFHLANELPEFVENSEKITFKRLLLNKCQEEFERGEREQAEADKTDEEGEIRQSKEEREVKRIKVRRRMLGNIRLIGELYKKKMLTERIMHECIKRLLGQYQNPDEEDLEALCKLMSTIGEMIDQLKAKEHMDAYFVMMQKLSTNQKISSRVRFMLRDVIDLRKNKWQQRRKVEGPKKIEEVHRDAAQERQAQASRLSRGSGLSAASRRAPPVDYGLRGSSVLPSPSPQQLSGARGFQSQARSYGTQDVRMEDRHAFENRALSLPLPQRAINDDAITLGPQGGLARGMSIRGQAPVSSAPLAETPPSGGEPCRMISGPNGYSSTPDRLPHNSREEKMQRFVPDRFSGVQYDQASSQDRNTYIEGRDFRIVDHVFDRSTASTIGQLGGSQNASPGTKALSEDILHEKSILAIKEFYSAKDEDEVAWCIKELNSPSFYPAMVSLWVTDSFERNNKERDLLATLLVSLCRSPHHLLSEVQLAQGFESVLSTLEDAVNDAPRAAEFLGRIFAKVIVEGVVPLGEIGRLIHEGGEKPGQLLAIGLASEVLGSILETIKTEKGDPILSDIQMRSDLKLEDFRPPHPIKSKRLEAFL